MLGLMFFLGSVSGFICLLLTKKLINNRTDSNIKSFIINKYSPILWSSFCALAFSLIYLLEISDIKKIEYIIVFLICLSLSVVDVLIKKIPNSLILVLIINKVVFTALNFTSEEVQKSLIGFGIAIVVFTLPSLLKMRVGVGDIKLAAIAGLYLGMTGFLQAMVIMAVSFTVYGIYMLIKKTGNFRTKSAMGPYLAFGLFCTLLFPLF